LNFIWKKQKRLFFPQCNPRSFWKNIVYCAEDKKELTDSQYTGTPGAARERFAAFMAFAIKRQFFLQNAPFPRGNSPGWAV